MKDKQRERDERQEEREIDANDTGKQVKYSHPEKAEVHLANQLTRSFSAQCHLA